jgi:hypothetical protein
MKVYIVSGECSDGAGNCHFDRVYSTKEKAIAYVKKEGWVYNSAYHLENIKRAPDAYHLITEEDFIQEVEVE